jgi:deoxycytidylate deaminase
MIGPLLVGFALFGTTASVTDEQIKALELNKVVILYMAVGLLFLAAAALFYFSKKVPKGISDDEFPWHDQGDFLQTKYPFVVHAEANAILNASQNLNGCKLFVTLFPCNECTKLIIQSGIKELVYVSNKDEGKDFQVASRKMLEKAHVKLRQISWESINV